MSLSFYEFVFFLNGPSFIKIPMGGLEKPNNLGPPVTLINCLNYERFDIF